MRFNKSNLKKGHKKTVRASLTVGLIESNLHFKTCSVGTSNKLVGFFQVGDAHVFAVPKEFSSSKKLLLSFAIGFSEHKASNGQIAHEHSFCHWASIIEGGGEALVFFGTKASLTGIYPLALVTRFLFLRSS